MKLLIASLFTIFIGASATALPIDWKLYMRSGSGTNAQGGKQFSLSNPGARGNEFRLGNETAYGEAYFNAHILEAKDKGEPFFDANVTLALMPQMDSQYSSGTASPDTQVIQAFLKGGNFDGFKAAFWAGKRFYRDVDLHMDDFFYFADMSGVGGGVEDIPLFTGTLAVAYMMHSDSSLQRTTNGVPQKQAIDVRWRDIKLSDKNILQAWFAGAYMPPGTGYAADNTGAFTVKTDYEATTGIAVGARWRHLCTDKIFNDATVMYGTGAMENFTMDGTPAFAANGTSLSRRQRTRVVDAIVMDYDKWSMQAGVVYEDGNTGVATPGHSRWMSIGVRPVYYFTDHYHLVFEAGHSSVKVDSETGTGGGAAGERTLDRITLAPEVAIGKGYFARPTIRAYVTHSMWNGANADAGNPNSLAGKLSSVAALDGRRDETQVGLQGEVWF